MNKQYLLVVDDVTMAALSKTIPGIKYIPVEGMNMVENTTHQCLVTPLVTKCEDVKPD